LKFARQRCHRVEMTDKRHADKTNFHINHAQLQPDFRVMPIGDCGDAGFASRF